MTLREIIDAVLEEVGYSSTGASQDVRVRLRRRVNEHHRRLLSMPTLSRLLRDSYSTTFASVSGTATYGLPPSIGRINAIYEGTNDIKLVQRSLTWLREEDAGLSSTGTPEAYIPLGVGPVKSQPSTASTVVAVSTDASDTDISLMFDYLDASGVRTKTPTTLSGTTPVTLATGVSEILGVTLAPEARGTVSLSINTVEIASIPIGASSSRYLRVQLWPTPTAAITYTVDATRDSTDMVEDNEEPLLPRDFHYLLVLGAVADEMLMRDDTRYEAKRLDMEQGKRDLNHWVWNNADYLPAGGPSARPSRLGGWFPAGS